MSREWYGSPETERVARLEKEMRAVRETQQSGQSLPDEYTPELLRVVRETLGIPREELANRVGLTDDQVRNYETRDLHSQAHGASGVVKPTGPLTKPYREAMLEAYRVVSNDPALAQRSNEVAAKLQAERDAEQAPRTTTNKIVAAVTQRKDT